MSLMLTIGCRSPETVRIGFVGGLSGSLADLGVGGRNGAQLAVDTLNSQNTLSFELLVEDDQQNPEVARAAVASLAKRRVSFIVGPMTSVMAVAAVPEADRLHVVLISPTATTHELSHRQDYLFRVAPDAPAGARQLARILFQHGARSLSVLMDVSNRAYSTSFGLAATEQFRMLGGKVVSEVSYESKPSLDFIALARRLSDAAPDAVLLVDSPGEAAIMAQQLRKFNAAVTVAISPWAANVQFLDFGGRAVEGAFALQAVDLMSERPAMIDFKHRYRARFGEDPTTSAVQTYEAVMVGAAALRRSDHQPLSDVLVAPGNRWPGLDGDIVFDAYGDTDKPLHMTQVHKGRFEAVQ